MKIIDSHLHIIETEGPLKCIAAKVGNTPTLIGLREEMRTNSIAGAVLISSSEIETPLKELIHIKMISEEYDNLKCIFGVSPDSFKNTHFSELENSIKQGYVAGIKIFPSYFSYYPEDKIYKRFYSLCIKYDIPAIFHTGAVMNGGYKEKMYQKYAHPIHIDDVAVDYPKMKILMSHAGYPWLIDAAQVAYKNENVYIDFSGLREGEVTSTDLLDKHIRWTIDYIGDEKKIMYGSDWPIIRMAEYIAWLSTIIPKRMQKKFFFENANKFFDFKL